MKLDLIKIKIAIANNCLSVDELSLKVGLSKAAIYRILNGKNSPTIKNAGLIAKALNVNIVDLIAEE